jgi:hypothetical protein
VFPVRYELNLYILLNRFRSECTILRVRTGRSDNMRKEKKKNL